MTCFQSSLGYHTWEILRRFSSTLCRFFALPADFLQHLQIFYKTCRSSATLRIFCNTCRFFRNTCRLSTTPCRFSATLFRFSAIPADFLQHSADFLQYLQIFL